MTNVRSGAAWFEPATTHRSTSGLRSWSRPGLRIHYKVLFAIALTATLGSLGCGDEEDPSEPILDTDAPSGITDLSASTAGIGSVTVSWTAPGDDGDVGTAASYDLRYATGVIDAGSWGDATKAPGVQAPSSAGTTEDFTLSGLVDGTGYSIAIISRDESGNESPLSNVLKVQTGSPDLVPPSQITDLAVIDVGATSVAVSWTAPGDDGDEGSASSYDLRHSQTPITEVTWSEASSVLAIFVPSIAGTTEEFTITELETGATHYFAIRAADEVPNHSVLSNTVEAETTTDLDAYWDPEFGAPPEGNGFDRSCYDLIEYRGALVVAGAFQQAGNISAGFLASWDGTRWTDLGGGVAGGVFPLVYSLAEFQGDLIVGGSFSQAGSVSANNIARWDGSNWHSLGVGTGDAVTKLAVFDDELIVGGWFSEAGNVAARRVARWDGVSWSSMGRLVNSDGSFSPVWALHVHEDDLYAGGGFDYAGEEVLSGLARWNGSTWERAANLTNTGSVPPTVAFLSTIDGELIAGGQFETADGVTVNHIMRRVGDTWTALGSGLSGATANWVQTAIAHENGLLVGGAFSSASGVDVSGLALWDGSTWSAFGLGVSGSSFPIVNKIMRSGSDIYVAGEFSQIGRTAASRFAKWSHPGIR